VKEFGLLNWGVLVAYMLATLAIGFAGGRHVDSAETFYLGRRNIPWWAIGISVVATYVSALTFLGGPAWSYSDGLSVIAIHLNYPLVIFVVITVFLPFFYNSGVASIYEYHERRFGATARAVISAIFLVSQALTCAAILYATALVLEFITGMDVVSAIIIIAGVGLLATGVGGATAVIWTDVMQAGVLFAGAFVILFTLVDAMPVPLAEAFAGLKAAGMTRALDFSFDPTRVATVWSGVIAMTTYHITVYGANQMMVQRTLAARNIGDAKKSYLIVGFAAFFIYLLFFGLGIMFHGYYGGRAFENGNTIILEFAGEYALPGMMGLIGAAVLAASMSTMTSALNSLSTVTTIDFYQKYVRRDGSSRHYLLVTRLLTVAWTVLIVVPAILFAHSHGSILQTLSKVGSYFVGAKLAMFGLGFYSRDTSERGLLVGVAVGFGVVWYVATWTDIAWPWFCLIGAFVSIAVSLVASLLIDGPQKEYSPYTVRGQRERYARERLPEKDGGWYVVPGRVDRVSYLLLAFFAAVMVFLLLLDHLA
jgi:SSS family solute:Na+ symporter